VIETYEPTFFGRARGLSALGVTCPEGSSTSAAYTGPEGPNGCRCASGRVWQDGRCQSPQSLAQQAGQSATTLAKTYSTPDAWATQPLSAAARSYLERMGHTVTCHLVQGAQTPAGNATWMACSIDGGPFKYGAYALNLNPGDALTEMRTEQAQQVAATTPGVAYGAAPGSAVYSTPDGAKAVTAAHEALKQQYGSELMPPDGGAYVPPNPVNIVGGPGGAPIAPGASSGGGGGPVPPQDMPPIPAGPGVDYFAWLPDNVEQVATGEWIAGIPNWLLIGASLGVGYFALKSH
jgi:hypothetical protein